MKRLRLLLILILMQISLLAYWGTPALSQTPTPSDNPLLTSSWQRIGIFAGPGDTYPITAWLYPGVEVTIIERNNVGNWLHINRLDYRGEVADDGWVMTGFLNHHENLHFSEVPVNTRLADADPSTVASPSLALLYTAPVIPEISDAMREVYLRGQELGNHSNVVTKIGDSLTADRRYLTPISRGDHELGPYDYFEETIDYFGQSTATDSIAARIGMNTYGIFDALWADNELCEPNESPLSCEYRRKQPSIAFIMFGPNDVRHMTTEQYNLQMRLIVEETLERGIIPVLSTFSADPEIELWWHSVNANLALLEIAQEYEIPLINLWAAARVLPEYGLDVDRVHLQGSGFEHIIFSTGHESLYGGSLRNLLSIYTLDAFRRTIIVAE